MPQIKNAFIRYRIIDRMLRSKYKPFPSKQDLRKACEEALFGDTEGAHICDSTIEKDLFAMRMEHDAPIKFNKKNNGYYYSDDRFTINDIPLTADELESIKFALNTLQQFREVPFFQQFGHAIDKISDRIAVESDKNADELGNYIQFETALSTGGSEHLSLLLDAIRQKKMVWFVYINYVKGVEKPRKVAPLFLKEYRNRWYLITYDVNKEDIITFALERMQDLKIEDETIKLPVDFDAQHYFKDSVGITVFPGQPEKISLKANKIAARYIDSQPFHSSQKLVSSSKEYTVFELNILISEEFIRSILSYAGEIEILKPKRLRKILAERIDTMSKLY